MLFFISRWLFLKPRINYSAVVLIVLFLVSQLISVLFSLNTGISFVRLWQYAMASLLGIYIASSPKNVMERIKFPLSLALLFQGLLVVFQFLSGSSIGFWILGERTFDLSTPGIATFNWQGQIFLRSYGTLPHPNVFAAFMLIGGLIYLKSIKKLKIRESLLLSLTLAAIVLSFSRSVIAIVMTEFLFFMRGKIVFLILLVMFLYPLLSIRYDSLFDFDNLSVIRREELAENSLFFFSEAPAFGVGLNNYIERSAKSELVSGTTRFFQPVHNIFLLTLSETGLVGFITFVFILIYPLFGLYKKVKQERHFYTNLYLAIFFLGFLDHYFLTVVQGQRLLFLVWGLSMLELSEVNVKRTSSEKVIS